jgi:hypothetical protein
MCCLPRSLLADAKIGRHAHDLLAGADPAGHQESTVRGGARILVNVHPGLGSGC